ncbi:hypothetical protein 2 [Beihai picorna-like virus 117]|uniref:hypothetical protein 2 n=1 Tax=Beihai picorna-like virus 117 TaxID=1922546 RepID=UPI00090A8C90|nr:hypothetical protein 2 [Beihai picorna-like virus 117]APG76770.1 hypothetical protein 2 [Beihai picorna-like virus 117]APG76820.1 hypothetical protein 2 [Beihai picorna-like virus 117]
MASGQPLATAAPVVDSAATPAGPLSLETGRTTHQPLSTVTGNFNSLDPFLYRHNFIIANFRWNADKAPGNLIWQLPLSPYNLGGRIAERAAAYLYWRGQISFEVIVVATGFHAGQLFIVETPPDYKPGSTQSISDLSTFHHEQVDVKVGVPIQFSTRDICPTQFHTVFDSQSTLKPTESVTGMQSIGGYISMFNLTKLTAANTAPEISIIVKACLDPSFEVSIMRPLSFDNERDEVETGRWQLLAERLNDNAKDYGVKDSDVAGLFLVGGSTEAWRGVDRLGNAANPYTGRNMEKLLMAPCSITGNVNKEDIYLSDDYTPITHPVGRFNMKIVDPEFNAVKNQTYFYPIAYGTSGSATYTKYTNTDWYLGRVSSDKYYVCTNPTRTSFHKVITPSGYCLHVKPSDITGPSVTALNGENLLYTRCGTGSVAGTLTESDSLCFKEITEFCIQHKITLTSNTPVFRILDRVTKQVLGHARLNKQGFLSTNFPSETVVFYEDVMLAFEGMYSELEDLPEISVTASTYLLQKAMTRSFERMVNKNKTKSKNGISSSSYGSSRRFRGRRAPVVYHRQSYDGGKEEPTYDRESSQERYESKRSQRRFKRKTNTLHSKRSEATDDGSDSEFEILEYPECSNPERTECPECPAPGWPHADVDPESGELTDVSNEPTGERRDSSIDALLERLTQLGARATRVFGRRNLQDV